MNSGRLEIGDWVTWFLPVGSQCATGEGEGRGLAVSTVETKGMGGRLEA